MNYKKLQYLIFDTPSVNDSWLKEFRSFFPSDYLNEKIDYIQDWIDSYCSANDNACDGYSKIAFYLMRQTSYKDRVKTFFSKDYNSQRQSWFFTLRYAESLFADNMIKEAVSLIENVYETHQLAVNGYASIAWSLSQKWNYHLSPYSFAKKDVESDRCSAGFLLNVAVLAQREKLDETANSLVSKAYEMNPNIKDGYSRCGWEKYLQNDCLSDLEKLTNKDQELKRLSVAQALKVAEAFGKAGQISMMKVLVDHCYQLEPSSRGLLTECAQKIFKPETDNDKIIECGLKDEALGRLHSSGMLILALSFAREGNYEEWSRYIELAYENDVNLQDCFINHASILFTSTDDTIKIIEAGEKDLSKGKLSIAGHLKLAKTYNDLNNLENCNSLIRKAYSKDSSLQDALISLADPKNTEDVISLGMLDEEQERLSPGGLAELAYAFAKKIDPAAAKQRIEKAYEGSETIKGVFTKAAEILLSISSNPAVALDLIQRDIDLERHNEKTSKLHTKISTGMLLAQSSLISNLRRDIDFLKNASFSPKCFPKPLEDDLWLSQAKDLHKGQRCFVMATGPSLNKVDLSKLKGEVIFGVNGTYKLDNIDITYFVYVSAWFWKYHLEGIKNVKCQRRFLPSSMPQLSSEVTTSWLNVGLANYYSSGGHPMPVPGHFSFEPQNYIFSGGTVLYLCLQLAHYMGFSEVIILGLDHSYDKKQDEKLKGHHGGFVSEDNSHFDQNYNPGNIEYHVDLEAMERSYVISNEIFNKGGRKIYNASPGTHLDTFEKIDFNSLFQGTE